MRLSRKFHYRPFNIFTGARALYTSCGRQLRFTKDGAFAVTDKTRVTCELCLGKLAVGDPNL